MRYWFDTEFMEDGHTVELLSIGIVSEDGRSFYAESADANLLHANEWVQANVVPYLHTVDADLVMRSGERATRPLMDTAHPDVMTRSEIAEQIVAFVGVGPEFWGYFCDYDWVVLCQLYGRMIDLPSSWPMYCKDVKQWCDDLGNPKLPTQVGREHHALEDARWTKTAWEFLDRTAVADQYVRQLEEAVNLLWGWMPFVQVKEIVDETPDLADLCRRIHTKVAH